LKSCAGSIPAVPGASGLIARCDCAPRTLRLLPANRIQATAGRGHDRHLGPRASRCPDAGRRPCPRCGSTSRGWTASPRGLITAGAYNACLISRNPQAKRASERAPANTNLSPSPGLSRRTRFATPGLSATQETSVNVSQSPPRDTSIVIEPRLTVVLGPSWCRRCALEATQRWRAENREWINCARREASVVETMALGGVRQLRASERQSGTVLSGCQRAVRAAEVEAGPKTPKPAEGAGFGSTERRRSRTYRAVGCTTAPVLKTGWATGPMPLRGERSAQAVSAPYTRPACTASSSRAFATTSRRPTAAPPMEERTCMLRGDPLCTFATFSAGSASAGSPARRRLGG
jgi:hypothetical protein